MLLKKGAVCTWITPEANNEEISHIWEKNFSVTNHVTWLLKSEIHQHAESQHKAYVSQSLHTGGVGDHTALETSPQKRRISLSLSRWLLAAFRLWNLTIFLIMVISHLFLLKMDTEVWQQLPAQLNSCSLPALYKYRISEIISSTCWLKIQGQMNNEYQRTLLH